MVGFPWCFGVAECPYANFNLKHSPALNTFVYTQESSVHKLYFTWEVILWDRYPSANVLYIFSMKVDACDFVVDFYSSELLIKYNLYALAVLETYVILMQ